MPVNTSKSLALEIPILILQIRRGLVKFQINVRFASEKFTRCTNELKNAVDYPPASKIKSTAKNINVENTESDRPTDRARLVLLNINRPSPEYVRENNGRKIPATVAANVCSVAARP